MSDEDSQDRALDAGQRIASSIRSIGQGPKKRNTQEELQKLKAAADRLDQILNAGADADREALRNAAARLDRLLVDIRKGKDVASQLKQNRERKETK